MSHVDEVDPRIKTDKSLVFSSGIIQEYLDLAHDQTGVVKDCIFPVSLFSLSPSVVGQILDYARAPQKVVTNPPYLEHTTVYLSDSPCKASRRVLRGSILNSHELSPSLEAMTPPAS